MQFSLRTLGQVLAPLVALACATPAAQAACDTVLAKTLAASLHKGRTLDEELAACKAWPAYPGRQIVVLPLVAKDDGNDDRTLDLDVLVVQPPASGTGQPAVLAHVFQPEALSSDAVAVRSIGIDTARYQLAPDALAFGVRVHYEGASRANPFGSDALRLYLPPASGSTLHEVLPETEVSGGSGEWDTNCAGRFEEINGVIAVRPTGNAGLADLALVQKRVTRVSRVQKGGECKDQASSPRMTTTLLRYDGHKYLAVK